MKEIISFLIIICCLQTSAQNNIPETTRNLFKANLLITPSLEYEQGITKNTTLGIQLGIDLGSIKNEELDETRIVLYPVLDIYYRYYYNFNRRAKKGKNTHNNSANYFGLTSSFTNANTIFNDIDPDDAYFITIAGAYGLQRTYFKKLNLGFEFGAGYGFSDIQESFTPILNFKFGWVFWSQSK